MTHALVGFTIAILWAAVERSNSIHTFFVHSVAVSTAIEQIQAQELTFVQGISVEDDCGGQDTVDWHRFKFVETSVFLPNKPERKIRKV